VSQQTRRGNEKRITILRIAQRRGANDGNPVEWNGPQPLRKTANAIEAPFNRRGTHDTTARPATELHLFFQALERDQFTVIEARNDQIERIRSEVERRCEAIHG
jgi:hypothetical protein